MKVKIVELIGGLGNQMFQYAFYLSLKEQNENDICKIDITDLLKYDRHYGYELDRVFFVPERPINRFWIKRVLRKKFFRSYLRVITESGDSIYYPEIMHSFSSVSYYRGYWQTAKYFDRLASLVKDRFCFRTENMNDYTKVLSARISSSPAVSIHVRRGDYENNEQAKIMHGGICDKTYYQKSIHKVEQIGGQGLSVFVFSDDPQWVRDNLPLLDSAFIVDGNKGLDSWQDMYLMTLCQYHIIANSTFSWWGAWLCSLPGKQVIAPYRWFNTKEAPDLIPEEWIKIR